MLVGRPRSRLATVLAVRGLLQQDLVAASGVSRPTVSAAYHDKPGVSLETWLKLAAALNARLDEIAPPELAARVAAVN